MLTVPSTLIVRMRMYNHSTQHPHRRPAGGRHAEGRSIYRHRVPHSYHLPWFHTSKNQILGALRMTKREATTLLLLLGDDHCSVNAYRSYAHEQPLNATPPPSAGRRASC